MLAYFITILHLQNLKKALVIRPSVCHGSYCYNLSVMCFDIKAFTFLIALTDAGSFLIKSFTRYGCYKSKLSSLVLRSFEIVMFVSFVLK